MNDLYFLPPGIEPKEWEALSPLGRALVEAGMYLGEKELAPKQLYVEFLIARIDPKDNSPHGSAGRYGITRADLKRFLQFLRISCPCEYTRRVTAAAENRRMQLSLVEDDVSLHMRRKAAGEE